jgi:hypothetical protein
MTGLDLLKAALSKTGKRIAPSAASTVTLRQLVTDAAALVGKTIADVSAARVTGMELLQEALGLLQSDMTETTDYEAAALVYINRLLIDLFDVNNSAMEADGATALTEMPSLAALTSSIPYEQEIVRNIMLYGLCRDLGMPLQNANMGYYASTYDERKKRYTLCESGKLTRTVVASANRMLADLFAINNDLLTLSGGAEMSVIPTVAALTDVLTYQDVLVRDVMVNGLAADIAEAEQIKDFTARYVAKSQELRVCASGSVKQVALSSVNGMLADLFSVHNGLLEAAAQAVLTDVPEVTALSEPLPYGALLNRNVMPFGLARDISLSENNLNAANIFAAQYEAGKNRQTVGVTGTITDYYAEFWG